MGTSGAIPIQPSVPERRIAATGEGTYPPALCEQQGMRWLGPTFVKHRLGCMPHGISTRHPTSQTASGAEAAMRPPFSEAPTRVESREENHGTSPTPNAVNPGDNTGPQQVP
ncbi:hypothetical protein N7532_000756 [Penicillium argentinense]|uniref:Uncharacterized protein n=1 Tax=Penicillium argentinense TaxID=1131581 RepID=A0A9W9KP55_9EURO|nr:uncharacterized protein N7532_000756 [Penicillium argentinense]KAJ5112711.1 hypothetical protein N7532_000756 [Penicillium argentinense]